MLTISKIKGVTLLEMLLVIAVTTTLMVGTLSLVRNKAANVKNDKAVLVMQQWLQAAISYYVVNQGEAKQGVDLKSILVQKSFMPPNVDMNPWGKAYDVYLTGKTIIVSTTVPESQAKIIQGNLPYTPEAKPTEQANVVLAAPVPVPDAAAIQYSDIVAGTQRNYATVPAPICPDEMTPEIFTVPVMYSSGDISYPIVQVGAYAEPVYESGKIKAWHVFSKLYTVKGAADKEDPNDKYDEKFKAYNKILVMTKCPQISDQAPANTSETLQGDPLINFK